MANTSDEFKELIKYFENAMLPASIHLDACVFVPDVKLFVDKNLACLGSGEMNDMAASGRYYRMKQLKRQLSKQ